MNEFIAWLVGLAVGFLWGAYMMFMQMNKKDTNITTIKMSKEEVEDILEITKLSREMKKELEK